MFPQKKQDRLISGYTVCLFNGKIPVMEMGFLNVDRCHNDNTTIPNNDISRCWSEALGAFHHSGNRQIKWMLRWYTNYIFLIIIYIFMRWLSDIRGI